MHAPRSVGVPVRDPVPVTAGTRAAFRSDESWPAWTRTSLLIAVFWLRGLHGGLHRPSTVLAKAA